MRSLVGCCPQGCKESDTTEAAQHSRIPVFREKLNSYYLAYSKTVFNGEAIKTVVQVKLILNPSRENPQTVLNRKRVVNFASGIAGSRCYKGMLSRLLYQLCFLLCGYYLSQVILRWWEDVQRQLRVTSAQPSQKGTILFLTCLSISGASSLIGWNWVMCPGPVTYASQNQRFILAAPMETR